MKARIGKLGNSFYLFHGLTFPRNAQRRGSLWNMEKSIWGRAINFVRWCNRTKRSPCFSFTLIRETLQRKFEKLDRKIIFGEQSCYQACDDKDGESKTWTFYVEINSWANSCQSNLSCGKSKCENAPIRLRFSQRLSENRFRWINI